MAILYASLGILKKSLMSSNDGSVFLHLELQLLLPSVVVDLSALIQISPETQFVHKTV